MPIKLLQQYQPTANGYKISYNLEILLFQIPSRRLLCISTSSVQRQHVSQAQEKGCELLTYFDDPRVGSLEWRTIVITSSFALLMHDKGVYCSIK
jgi:hypothetical protein